MPHDAQSKSLQTSISIKKMSENLGLRPIRIVPNIPIDTGIQRVRANFSKLWIDQTKCEDFIDKIAQYRKAYDEKGRTFKARPVHDFTSHACDALRYFAVSLKDTQSYKKETSDWITERIQTFDKFSPI